jgi:hypothetical protein
MCEFMCGGVRRYRIPNDPQPKGGLGECVDVPARTLVFDVMVHAEVYPDWRPLLQTVQTGARGMANPNDPTRDSDVLPVVEHVESLGWGIERFRAEEIPDYTEMLRQVCDTLGWDAQRFRGYRAKIDYPIFNSELQFVIDLPLAPSASTDKA